MGVEFVKLIGAGDWNVKAGRNEDRTGIEVPGAGKAVPPLLKK